MSYEIDYSNVDWHPYLSSLGVPLQAIGQASPCPICDGTDRFVFDDKNGLGSSFCRKCDGGNKARTGSQLAIDYMGWTAKELNENLKEYLGGTSNSYTKKKYVHEQGERKAVRSKKPLANRVKRIVSSAKLSSKHPYMLNKGIKDFDVLVSEKTIPCSGMIMPRCSIVVPIQDVNGALVNCQVIDGDGNKRFLPGKGSLGAGFHLIGNITDDTEAVLVTEGYASGASLKLCSNCPVVVTFSANNMHKVAEVLRAKYPDVKLTFMADDDDVGEGNNTGLSAANKSVSLVGGAVLLPPFSENEKGEKKGTKRKYSDWDDFRQLYGQEETSSKLKELITNAIFEPIKVTLKPAYEKTDNSSLENTTKQQGEFIYKPDGVYVSKSSIEDTASHVRIFSPITVEGYGRDPQGSCWKVLVKFSDRLGEFKQACLPLNSITGNLTEAMSELVSQGMPYVANTRGWTSEHMRKFFMENEGPQLLTFTKRAGWHVSKEGGHTFVLPHQSFGENAQATRMDPQVLHDNPCGTSTNASLEMWQESVSCYCSGNSRLLFAVSSAFAAPLLTLMHMEGGGFHFGGASSDGKTTCLYVASSVFGSPNALQSWRTTGNAIEATACKYNDMLLPLDEIKQANSNEVAATAYMLANGKGKARANRNGDLNKIKEWNLLALSTGELGFDEMIKDANQESFAGIEVRFPEIPSSTGHFGAFEHFHEFESPKEFAEQLKVNAAKNYGVALEAYLQHLTVNLRQYTSDINQQMAELIESWNTSEVESQVLRVANRFALVGVAGELATKFGITGWGEGQALWAAKVCFNSWLNNRGFKGNKEHIKALQHVRDFIYSRLNSHFAYVTDVDAKNTQLIGWKEAEECPQTKEKQLTLKIPPNGWRTIAERSGLKPTELAKVCVQNGLMQKPSKALGQKSQKGYQFNSTLPGMGSVKHYRLKVADIVNS
ncbi:MAG: DUF927 domain-containing protein [Pseudomonadota bacterium]|nr:DUF927 domain-containing protein [Pseudomonadota bacterium]